ncbi:MAG: protein kinase domain-containing protein [Solirubrobacteraceae bacterium]
MTGTTTIAGRYRIEGRLGVGGMSTVHLAFDSRLERYVALKLLAEHLADDPTFVSRFRREALAAARLVHPNIVQVFDFGFDSGHHQHFIVMEHVSGSSCAELLRDHGKLPVARALEVVSQACRGLDYAHRNGVVHRDVKPGNLLVSDSDVVKLADFGIARATDQSSITQAGSVLGTAAYLSPEQARGDEAGPQADLYSLGVVTYQLIAGRLPYEASSLSELALKQQREAPIPLDELRPEVPHALARAIAAALAIDQRARPADAAALAESLADGARGIAPEEATIGLTAQTRVVSGPRSASTRVAPRPSERTGQTARAPRQVPARRPAQAAVAYDRREREPAARRGRGLSRVLALLAILGVLALIVIAALTISNGTSQTVVHAQKIITNDAQSAIHQLQSLISQYTK